MRPIPTRRCKETAMSKQYWCSCICFWSAGWLPAPGVLPAALRVRFRRCQLSLHSLLPAAHCATPGSHPACHPPRSRRANARATASPTRRRPLSGIVSRCARARWRARSSRSRARPTRPPRPQDGTFTLQGHQRDDAPSPSPPGRTDIMHRLDDPEPQRTPDLERTASGSQITLEAAA